MTNVEAAVAAVTNGRRQQPSVIFENEFLLQWMNKQFSFDEQFERFRLSSDQILGIVLSIILIQ